MSEILKKIIEVLKIASFKIKSVAIDSEIRELPDWDSLKHLTFLIEIEKEFNIEISPEEIKSIVTIGDLINKIEHDNSRA